MNSSNIPGWERICILQCAKDINHLHRIQKKRRVLRTPLSFCLSKWGASSFISISDEEFLEDPQAIHFGLKVMSISLNIQASKLQVNNKTDRTKWEMLVYKIQNLFESSLRALLFLAAQGQQFLCNASWTKQNRTIHASATQTTFINVLHLHELSCSVSFLGVC